MQRKTLGGDRLGAGKKMQVELHGYERSTHDLSYIWRSSMSAGTLVPFMSKVMLPGDTFDINLECDVKTLPTIGPLFGSYKVQLDVFMVPIRLYNSLLHNNKLGIGLDMSKVKLPQIELSAVPSTGDATDIDNAQINPSCILSYLGIRGIGYNGGQTTVTRQFNCIPLLAYWDIYKNYYANKQEKIGAVIHATQVGTPETVSVVTVEFTILTGGNFTQYDVPQAPAVGGGYVADAYTKVTIEYNTTPPDMNGLLFNLQNGGQVSANELFNGIYMDDTLNEYIVGTFSYALFGADVILSWEYIGNQQPVEVQPEVITFDLENIDTVRDEILAFQSTTAPYVIDGTAQDPYSFLCLESVGEKFYPVYSQEGLALKTYQSDLFNNWLDAEYMDAISDASAVSTVGNSFTIDQLNLSQKIYEMLNRIAVSGGSYNDWIDAAYGITKTRMAESPIYMGGLSKELVFQEVVSNAESGGQPLGTLAGRGRLSDKHKGGYIDIRVEEPAYCLGIISLTPRIDYSQGNEWDVNLQTMDDLHKPGLDQIGFQDLITEQMAWWTTYHDIDTWRTRSAGKQPAWINYMTSVNKTHGNFAIANKEMFMTLNRRYEEAAGEIADLTTYIDPAKFNFIFAQTSLDAQNFWVQIGVNITARRKMSAKIMPNL